MIWKDVIAGEKGDLSAPIVDVPLSFDFESTKLKGDVAN